MLAIIIVFLQLIFWKKNNIILYWFENFLFITKIYKNKLIVYDLIFTQL